MNTFCATQPTQSFSFSFGMLSAKEDKFVHVCCVKIHTFVIVPQNLNSTLINSIISCVIQQIFANVGVMVFKLLQNIIICQTCCMENKQVTTNFIIISIYSNWSSTNHLIVIRNLVIIIYIYTLCTFNCTTMVKWITIMQLELLNTSIINIELCIIKMVIVITNLLITFKFLAYILMYQYIVDKSYGDK